MPILISIPDNGKFLVEPIEQLVASVTRTQHRSDGGRAVKYASVERAETTGSCW